MRYAKIPGGLALTFMCLSSCQNQLAFSPETSAPVELRTQQLQRAIIARQGEFTALALDVTTLDSSSRAVVGAPVRLSVIEGEGDVAPEIAISDSTGHARALYFALVTRRESHVRILATVPGDTLLFDLSIRGVSAPASVEFVSPPTNFLLNSGSSSTFQLHARVLGSDGAALLSQPLRFRVISGAASISSASDPDGNGVVSVELRHNGYDFTPITLVVETAPLFEPTSIPASLISPDKVRRLLPSASASVSTTLTIPLEPAKKLFLTFLPSNKESNPSTKIERVAIQARFESGEAAPGVVIHIESDVPGMVGTPSAITNANGLAIVTLWHSAPLQNEKLRAFAPAYGASVERNFQEPR